MLDHGLKISMVRGMGLLASNTDPKETVQIIRQISEHTINVSLRNGESFQYIAKNDIDMRLAMMELMGYTLYDINFRFAISNDREADKADAPLLFKYIAKTKRQLIDFFNGLIVDHFEFEPLMQSIVQDVVLMSEQSLENRRHSVGKIYNFKVTCFVRNQHIDLLCDELQDALHHRAKFITDSSEIFEFDEDSDDDIFDIRPRVQYQPT